MPSLPELTFSRNSASSTFSFQIENAESPEMFSFSINLRDFLSNLNIWHYINYTNLERTHESFFFQKKISAYSSW